MNNHGPHLHGFGNAKFLIGLVKLTQPNQTHPHLASGTPPTQHQTQLFLHFHFLDFDSALILSSRQGFKLKLVDYKATPLSSQPTLVKHSLFFADRMIIYLINYYLSISKVF